MNLSLALEAGIVGRDAPFPLCRYDDWRGSSDWRPAFETRGLPMPVGFAFPHRGEGPGD
jgi:hypothetical protein